MSLLKINFFDDGAATEPDAVMAAILALTAGPSDSIWLWISGKDKGADLENLANLILKKQAENKIFRLSLCGEVGQNLAKKLSENQTENSKFTEKLMEELSSLEKLRTEFGLWLKTQNLASGQNSWNLNIVLSPCGSSFDEFGGYKERSHFWSQHIQNLK